MASEAPGHAQIGMSCTKDGVHVQSSGRRTARIRQAGKTLTARVSRQKRFILIPRQRPIPPSTAAI
eukprot:2840466-Prymnesium_polylepis.1